MDDRVGRPLKTYILHNVAAFTLLAVPAFAFADDGEGQSRWTFNGFGTLSYTNTDKYDDRIPRRNINQSGADIQDNGFLLDSRIGFQSKWHINDRWEVTAQAVLREQLDDDPFDYVDMLYVSYFIDNEWKVGVGRQAFDLFFMSDHHNTGYSYSWVRPPTEFYGTMPYQSFDGLKISRNWGDFDNSWRWRLSVGNIDSKFDADVLVDSDDVDKTEAKPIYSTELTWQTGQWHLRGSYAHMKFKHELGDDAERSELDMLVEQIGPFWEDFTYIVEEFTKDFILRTWSLGFSWEHEDWHVQSEWSTVDSDFITFDGQRAYFHVAKRYQDWQPFVTFGWARDDSKVKYKKPPAGAPVLDEFYMDMVNFAHNMRHNQKSISLGARWDFSAQKALKLQCDRFYFDKWSGSIHGRVDFRYPQDETRSWCSVSFDWVF